MNYRNDKYGNPLSVLGLGCMRFPRRQGRIDLEKTEALIRTAVEAGINYFDTAYIYPGSEAVVGEILEKCKLRDRVNIATKLPHYLIKSMDGVEKLFQEELRRLRTDHVDYYLMHMLNDIDTWHRLEKMGICQWIEEKKRNGQIRQIGFSYHGGTEMFCQILDAWDWDFCQVQYNYLDEHSQAGRRGVAHAYAKGIPVVIMEPLRGGRLVDQLPASAKKIIGEHPSKRSAAEWGLRWLWNQQEVSVVLSGMSTLEMLHENIRIASDTRIGELGPDDEAMYAEIVNAINSNVKIGCTGCGYCQPCPKGVDIPGSFAAYNRYYGETKIGAFMDYLKCTTVRKNASGAGNCIGCGKCEKHCPQGIAIRQELKNVQKTFETPVYKVIRKAIEKFLHL